MSEIRPLSICIFRSGDRILVAHGFDSVKQEPFRRPLGGAIEFGETAREALRREIQEELSSDIDEPHLLGVLENVFTCEGKPGHEIVFVFDARLPEQAWYERGEVRFDEAGWEGRATWERPEDLARTGMPLYPEGLTEMLAGPGGKGK